MVLVLSREDIASLLKMEDVIAALEKAFKDLGGGKAQVPPRNIMEFPNVEGWVGIMQSSLDSLGTFGTKVVSVFKANAVNSKTTTMATILLNSATTGEPLAIIEGGLITAMRTGAASAIATKYLARNDARIVGLFGAGVQAKYQILGISKVRRISVVSLYTPTKARSRDFARKISKETDAEIKIVKSSRKAVEDSDVVITATTSPTPVFEGRWLQKGTHVNAIGAHTKNTRELDTYTIMNAKIVVESREIALKEAGEILIPLKEGKISKNIIYADLSELALDKKVGRTSDFERTIYKGCGMAIEDLATAKLAYDIAIEEGLGTDISL